MRLLLSTAKRTTRSPWICYSCRNARQFSIGEIAREGLPEKRLDLSSTHSEALRAQGPARTRFAPSPTGYLHLGSLRTALFNYLVAKATGGQFLLRIEDTDQKRTIPDAEQRLFEDLEWAGIQWDEGPKVGGPYGPYKQSERTSLYREHADKLLQSGHAYRCFCTTERLNKLAQYRNVEGNPINYDRACYRKYTADQAAEMAAQGTPHIIRLKSPKRYPLFHDLVYGNVFKRKAVPDAPGSPTSYEDPVLVKSDGFPTYHLANVVDDHHMNITHVIRGAEWMSSTPKHLAMYDAFGWAPPKFAHVGLLLDTNRAKLSKRNQDIDIASFRKQGVFPETLTNFVALLGWSHSQPKDIMSLEDLIKHASMKYTRGDTVVSSEKLWFLQKAHTARYASLPPPINPSHSLLSLAVEPIMALLAQAPPEETDVYNENSECFDQKAYVTKLLLADAAKYTTPPNFLSRNKFFFTAPTKFDLRCEIPLLQLGNKSFITTPLIDGSKALSVEAGTYNTKTLELPPSIPVIAPSTFLPFIAQFNEIPHSEWKIDELKNWINIVSNQASSLTPTLETWRIKDEAERQKVESKLKKAWGKLVHDYLRFSLLGGMSGPDSAETMVILGRREVLKRLRASHEVMWRWDEYLQGREQAEMHKDLNERAKWEEIERSREQNQTKEMAWNGMA